MKTAVIYKSIHHENTKKVAEVFAENLNADLYDLKDFNEDLIEEYDLLGFGSGIYYYKPHKKLRKFVEGLSDVKNKKAFHFSTSGNGKYYDWLEKKLSDKGFEMVGEFHCKGWDTYGPLKLVGGHNKGQPNEEDLKNAEVFANQIKEKYQ